MSDTLIDTPDLSASTRPDNPALAISTQHDKTQRTIYCLKRAKAMIEQQDRVLRYTFVMWDLVCTSGALALGEGECACVSSTDSHQAVLETLQQEGHEIVNRIRYPHDAAAICDWNNREGRTIQDIADLFQRTIDRLEAAV